MTKFNATQNLPHPPHNSLPYALDTFKTQLTDAIIKRMEN